jgi:hypothetical protein
VLCYRSRRILMNSLSCAVRKSILHDKISGHPYIPRRRSLGKDSKHSCNFLLRDEADSRRIYVESMDCKDEFFFSPCHRMIPQCSKLHHDDILRTSLFYEFSALYITNISRSCTTQYLVTNYILRSWIAVPWCSKQLITTNKAATVFMSTHDNW